jgi:tRNA (guanine37-N1)-methyltransferase
MRVPEVLLSGHHGQIRTWRHRAALERTLERRPDMLSGAALDDEERAWLAQLMAARAGRPGDEGSR